MATKLVVEVFAATLFLSSAFGIPSHRTPHLCTAEGESWEECPHAVMPSNYGASAGVPRAGPLRAEIESLKVRFLLYKNVADPESYVEIYIDDMISLQNANPYPSTWKSWKILIPGFPLNGRSPFPQNVRDAYFQRMRDDPSGPRYNILVVDWGQAGCQQDTTFPNGTLYTEAVGRKVADMILYLNDRNVLNLSMDVHVIGFSIGAHVAGEMSRFIFQRYNKKNLLYRVTALDPAGGELWHRRDFTNGNARPSSMPSPIRKVSAIRRSFVWFLDVYHTSKDFGIQRHIGDIDFFPNGGNQQDNACAFSSFYQLCSHLYVTALFAESITNRGIKGCTGCDEYSHYRTGKCGVDGQRCEDEPYFGDAVDKELIEKYPIATGRAYLDYDLPNLRRGQFGVDLRNRFHRSDDGIYRPDIRSPLCD